MRPKRLKCLHKVWHHCTLFSYIWVGARVSLKVATKAFFSDKKLLKLRFLNYFSETEAEEYNQEDWSVFDEFGIITPCSAPYHLKVGARFSLKVATKASFGGKETSENLDFRVVFYSKNRVVPPERLICLQ